jgi:hypothetical protein
VLNLTGSPSPSRVLFMCDVMLPLTFMLVAADAYLPGPPPPGSRLPALLPAFPWRPVGCQLPAAV